MSISDANTVTSVQARAALLAAFKAKRPLFLWGPAGIGKSEIVADIAAELGGPMIDMRMAQCEATDLRGLPYFNKVSETMSWAPPVELPSKEFASQHPIVVLFLDEMNSAPPSVQAAGYQLILNRRIGTYELPDNVVIVAAGNRDGDKGVTYRMPMPLANRFIHIELRADFTSWQEWAVNHKIHKDVVGYLTYAKQDLCTYDAKSSTRAFATPRTWTFVSDLLQDEDTLDRDTLYNLVAGTVGEGIAVKFMAHRKVSSQMPNPTDILEGKVKELKIKEISAQYSLVISLCYELKDLSEKKDTTPKKFNECSDNFFTFMMDNFETELVVLGARTAIKTYQLNLQGDQMKSFDRFQKGYGKYIVKAAE